MARQSTPAARKFDRLAVAGLEGARPKAVEAPGSRLAHGKLQLARLQAAQRALPQPAPQPPPSTVAPVTPEITTNRSSGIATAIFALAVVAATVWGFLERSEKHIVPASGLGYALGIIGGLMMLSMLLYSKRKKVRGAMAVGSVKLWFQAHMILGVLGPLLILFHANFQLKSTNSTIAMSAMLTVVFSGIIGRYIYAKIHSGLYGKRAELSSLIHEARGLKRNFGLPLANAPGIEAELRTYEAELLANAGSGRESLKSRLTLDRRVRQSLLLLQGEIQALLTAKALREGWDARTLNRHIEAAGSGLEAYFAVVRKAAGLRFYERLFSMWHLLHMPLFLLLILATVLHIIAVHIY